MGTNQMAGQKIKYQILPNDGISFDLDDVRTLPCPATQSDLLDDQCARFVLLNAEAPLGQFLARPVNFTRGSPVKFQFVVGDTEALSTSSPVPFPNWPNTAFAEFRKSIEAFVNS